MFDQKNVKTFQLTTRADDICCNWNLRVYFFLTQNTQTSESQILALSLPEII